MKITLYNAPSIDGYIARRNEDSDWVSPVDTKYFEETIRNAGCMIVSRKTYEQFLGDIYPIKGVLNVVMTRNKALLKKSNEEEQVLYTDMSISDLMRYLEIKGFSEAILVGGGTLNAFFLKMGMIDEIILTIHPRILGQGISIFEGKDFDVELKLLDTKELDEGLVQVRYKVLKS